MLEISNTWRLQIHSNYNYSPYTNTRACTMQLQLRALNRRVLKVSVPYYHYRVEPDAFFFSRSSGSRMAVLSHLTHGKPAAHEWLNACISLMETRMEHRMERLDALGDTTTLDAEMYMYMRVCIYI